MSSFLTRRLGVLALAVAVGCMAVCLGSTAHATLLWYDGFAIGPADAAGPNYDAGILGGQQGGDHAAAPGGIGWFDDGAGDPNPWLGVNPGDATADDNYIEAGSLSKPYQVFPSTGDRATSGPSVFSCCYTSRTSRDFNAPLQELEGTYYMSFLVNFGQGNPNDPHYRSVEFWNGKGANGRVGDDQLSMSLGFSSFGNYNDAVNQGLDPNPNTQLSLMVRGVRELGGLVEETKHQFEEHLEYADQNGYYLPQSPNIHNFDSKTHCIVLRFDLTADDAELGGVGDRVRAYLNPPGTLNGASPGTDEPAIPSVDVSSVDINMDAMSALIQFAFTGEVSNPGGIDELRVGTEWNDVVCCDMPEPGTLALVALGAIGLLVSNRRKVA